VPSFLNRRDPFWEDGRGARRVRTQQKIVRFGVLLIAVTLIAVVVTRLPAVDPSFLTGDAGRPIIGGALLALLASCVLVGLAKMRHTDQY
jgi:uncharacterized integral membrane protein